MDPFIGTIMMWPSTRIPVGWVICDGRSLSISGNEMLYSLIGTTYGGNSTSFNVPDMRGIVPVGSGQPAGATKNYIVGQQGGMAAVALQQSEMPTHAHTPTVGTIKMTNSGSGLQASKTNGTLSVPNSPNNALAAGYCAQSDSAGDLIKVYNYGASATPIAVNNSVNVTTSGAIATVALTGGSAAHDNIQPTMGINYIICLQGIYPVRP